MGMNSDSSSNDNWFDIHMTFFLVTTILTLGRMWMDIFILAVNCRDWMKKKGLSLTDRILTLQGSVKMGFGCVGILWHTLAKFCPWATQIDFVIKMFRFGLGYFTACNFWLTASLCSYYCLKIADFRHSSFIRLKLRLPGLVTIWLLMLLSLASSLPYAISDLEVGCNRSLSYFFRNKNVSYDRRLLQGHVLLGLEGFVAFTICVTSAALLLFSLWRHHQRMLGSLDDRRTLQTKAHFQAVAIILSLLVKNIFIFISLLLLLSSDFEGNCIVYLTAVGILYSWFLVESLISLWSNKKLRNELRRALCFAKCRGRAT